ncbi:MAG TPA: putative DNA binding domain-containing protein [Candidatus Caccomorpha excrementavium]|nr:putative DNA binding domain-containing protein [Candidatus Caccomorpha excrementavium]
MINRWIAEATECDFKVALEAKKPKSWLKSVSAFANGIGGTLFFGIDNDRNVIGLADAQTDAETISRLIKERITPYPNFILAPERENGKDILVLSVSAGRSTPYYYKADGIAEAYIRIGNESVIAPSYVLNQLLLKGMNRTYDALDSEYDFRDYAFSKLRERYKAWTGNSMEEKLFDSFEIRDDHGKLTNAGALLADDAPIKHSRLFCTRWNGLDKSGGMVDALDSAEYSGSLIILLNEGVGFVKRNMKTRWKKTANSRIEMPDYCERSVFEALVNALIHRDYLILGSEVHIDIYDDRLTITSPGGMADGTRIQERDISNISSTRRNPVLADIFGRLGYMERQGSGFKKITESYRAAHNYRAELEPKFYSDASSFQVTLYNLNYGQTMDKTGLVDEKQAFNDEKTGLQDEKQAFESLLAGLGVSAPTRKNILKLLQHFGFDTSFARADVMQVVGITATPATELMRKMKEAKLIESAKGRGKYKFVEPKE